MGMPRHCIKLIAIILLGQLLIQAVTSVAVIKIRFLYYSNQRGWLYNGHRCDNRFFFGRHCDPFFTIKLEVSGETFRYETDREKGANTVYFGSKIVNIDNPIVNRIENYQGHLDISVRVDDFDSVTSNDYMGSFHHRFSATAKPFGDLSAPTEVHLVDNGMAAANLALQISVQCEVHYYGSDCSKFCQPRSDYNGGHYYCDMDGNKICKPTYNLATGCREKFCSSEPCKNGGRCIDLPDKFVCKCRPSFGGATCIRELQPCQYSRPCQNGGTCIARVGCACPAGFHGDACQFDVDECRSISPCRGKGSVCENWFGTYSCHCGPGWRGQNCTEDIDECSQSSLAACFNGGKCENTPGSFTCHCPLGYRGEKCEEDINECAVQTIDDGQLSSPCNGNGSICEDLIGDYKCVCGPGWRGQNCTEDIDECALESGFDSSVCLNGGTCRNILGGFVCLCPTGFSGEQCQDDVDECANQAADGDNQNLLCHGNGSFCKNLPGNYSCICGPGWTGRHCTEDINECELNDSSAICLNDGVCVNLPGSFKCQCKLGFRGDHCQVDVDECTNQFDHQSLLCNGNGSYCKNLPGNYSCICGPGWTGRHCAEDIDECKLNNYTTMCLNGGVCANLPGSFECHCKTGFRGDRCQEDIEECLEGDGPCNNETHVCKNLIGSFSCLCRDGQVSPNCTAPIDPTLQLSKDDSTWWTPVIAFVIAFVITITILSSALLILLYLRPSFCHFLPFWRFRRLSDTTAVFKGCGSTEAENPVYDVGDEATLDVGDVSSAAVYEVPGPANRSNQSENRNSVIPPQLPPRPQVALIGGLPYQQMSNLSSAADSTCSYEEPNSVIRSSAGFSAYLG